jgi:hypothetical protein
MTIRELTLSPAGQKGFGMFLTKPNDKSSMVYVFTVDYVKHILTRQNMQIAQQYGLNYTPSPDGNPTQPVTWIHAVYLAQGWESKEPHMVELVDDFYDFKTNETDFSKAVLNIKKRYNVMFGAILDPPYPELVPVLRLPLPTSPFG